ncbi:hypothetical protein LRAMOSA00912 [Lichtheimia ramosa]|uniref:PPM-type phosphatase domain-containing protein n=1 Tax=Lichtheimia ramosa TaxID=688394 RepID=A0A077W9Q7_9FUNG|nr:hypothetical protein LRAMOSA00912 [Lichtheimia ramosa]
MTTLVKISTATALASAGLGYAYYSQQKSETPKPKEFPKHFDPHPFQHLSQQEIDTRLRGGQIVNRSNAKWVKAIYTNRMASNNPVEDNYSVNTFQGSKLLAGVYDGHVGPFCSEMIKEQLPIYVARQLEQEKPEQGKATENAISTAFEVLDQDIQQRFYDLFPKNVSRLSENDVREAIARHPNAKTIINEAITGSCACAVYIDDDNVYAANAGDSRVVVIRQEKDGSWTGRRMVEEQSPAHPAWRAHLISQHPPNEADAIVRRNRIFGLIAVGGCFGDIMYKVPKEYQMNVLPFIPQEIYNRFARYHHQIIRNYWTPPYLQSKPLVAHYKLQPGDRFIVLGTDGLWDELSWDSVRSKNGDQVAAVLMSTWPDKEDQNAATHLMRQALLYEAVYKNVGVKEPVSDPVLELSKRLTRQPSRRYRDDITITVIELDGQGVHQVKENAGPVFDPQQVDTSKPRLAEPGKSSWYSGWIWSRL